MNRRRILRSWWLWAAVILFAFLILPSLLSGGSDYHGVSTSDAIAQLKSGNVEKAIVQDKEQNLQLQLKTEFQGKYSKISTQYPSGVDQQIYAALNSAKSADDATKPVPWRTVITK